MKNYVFTRKLIVILSICIFAPTVLVCVLVGCNTISGQNRKLEMDFAEIERLYKSSFREIYKDCSMLIRSIVNYNTLNEMLVADDELQLGKMMDYSFEIRNVLDSIMVAVKDAELTIYTENHNVPEIKYIEKSDEIMSNKYNYLKEDDGVVIELDMDDEEAFLVVLRKYKLTADEYIGYNIIEFKIPFESILPIYKGGEQIFYTVYEDQESGLVIPLCDDVKMAEAMYEAYTDGLKGLHLECSIYEMDYFPGNFYILMDRKSYMEAVVKIICYILGVFCMFAICIIWIIRYTTMHLTRRLVNIVSTIQYDSIEMLLCGENNKCDEFDIIEKKIASLAGELKKENEKVLALELESLNCRIAPHFIYNNLSVLKWKCNDDSIENIIDCLVLYYRNVFQRNSAFTTVEEDVTNLVNYIRLLQFAYEEDFEYKTEVDRELLLYKIPSNMIQPLIENAFFHGINNIKGRTGQICLKICKQDWCVVIEVWDNGNKEIGNAKNFQKKSSTVVIDKRIKLYYGSSYGLQRFTRNEFTIARIQIPYKEEREV